MNRKFFVLIAIAVLGLTGCQKDDEYSGNGIRFSVSTGTEGTKTSYGDVTGTGTAKKQRIDWTIGDQIRILCPEVSAPSTLYQDYQVTSVATAANGNSQGKIALVNANDEPLQWNATANTPHNFYAVYPSPANRVEGYEVYIGDGNIARTAIVFPEEETLIDNVTETPASSGNYIVTPDTKYLYMMAQTLGLTEEAAGTRQEVFLTFLPVSTAIEFTVTNNFSSEGSMNVQEVFLNSSAPLWGVTKADFGWTGSKPVFSTPVSSETLSNADDIKKTGIVLGSDTKPLTLAYGKTLTFTFFLPANADITNLTFGITGTNNTTHEGFTRSTAISKSDGTPIVFGAFQKHFVKGILVPEGATWIVAGDVSVTSWNETSVDLNFDE